MCRPRIQLLIALLVALILPMIVFASPSNWEMCDECHGIDGMGNGDPMTPVIAGIPAGHTEEAIFAYVDGARRCVKAPVMCDAVAALTEAEVAEVSEYYANMERSSPGEEFDRELAAEGEVLHRKYCSRCHLPPDDEDAAYAAGIPLHGQRSEYLFFAHDTYLTGDRESLLEKMAEKMRKLEDGDLAKLVNYYSSYRSQD